jgi:capsular polysaccharide biosynthesis protein
MSETREIIKEMGKANRRTRLVNTILWVVVVLLVGVCVYVANIAVSEKQKTEQLLVKEKALSDELQLTNTKLAEQAEELRISEENLQGEKAKLEEFKISYDSIRQVLLEAQNQDELWDITVQTNTVQAYTDYIKIKGVNDRVLDRLNTLLTKTGYVQIQESNGTLLFNKVANDGGLNIWIPKTARSVRNGVLGKTSNSSRNGDVIMAGQPVRIVEDSIYTGNARWAKIKY